jgi:hypothetical protein
MSQLWKSFGNDFWVGNDSVFLDSFCVNRCCVGWRINSSPMKEVSGAYFWVDSEKVFLNGFWVNKGVGAEESMRDLWKQFRGLFLSGQRLSFPWLFMSQQGLCGLTNLWVSSGKVSLMIYEWATTQFSLTFVAMSRSHKLITLTSNTTHKIV